MNVRQANCPTCAAPVSFRPGTHLSICGYCGSAIARSDRDIRLVGRVAALVDTHSPLKLGTEGSYQGSGFALVGRTQLSHPAGGIWDEWYLAFDDGRWGWLAEAQGHFYLMFESKSTPDVSPDGLVPGAPLQVGQARWRVQEVGTARLLSAAGELPTDFSPGEIAPYVDIVTTGGGFGTLDTSVSPPRVFMGREVNVSDLRLSGGSGYSDKQEIQTQALSCPNCAAPLPLRLPDLSQRVTCANCSSLLDASHGALAWLATIPTPSETMILPPGTEGTLRGQKYTAIGFMTRYCTVEQIQYFWSEYLLYHPDVGFRWLVESDHHWTLVTPVSSAEIQPYNSTCDYQGKTFKKFQEVHAHVASVYGEFYWKVEVGETVLSADFVSPPDLLSYELADYTEGEGAQRIQAREAAWSLGTYITGKEVYEAFGLKADPPRPSSISPNQPNPHADSFHAMTRVGFVLFALLLVIMLGVAVTTTSETVFYRAYTSQELRQAQLAQRTAQLPRAPGSEPEAAGAPSDGSLVIFSEPFEIKEGRHGIEVTLDARVDNSWAYVDGALVSEQTGQIAGFGLESSYYHGVDGGESWSEGGTSSSAYISPLPVGTYVLRMAILSGDAKPPEFTIKVETGQTRAIYAILAFIAICLGPLVVVIQRTVFETRRWQESMFSE